MESVLHHIGKSFWMCSNVHAIECGDYLRKEFYSSLKDRRPIVEESAKRERTILHPPVRKNSTGNASRLVGSTQSAILSFKKPTTTTRSRSLDLGTSIGSTEGVEDLLMQERAMANKIQRFLKTIPKSTTDINGGSPGVNHTIIPFLEGLLGETALYCKHLSLLLLVFTGGRAVKSKFGSYHVELIIALFRHLKDIQNFELILMRLTPVDHACIMGRLGCLTIFNPVKPEGNVRVHLSYYDQRQVETIYYNISSIFILKNNFRYQNYCCICRWPSLGRTSLGRPIALCLTTLLFPAGIFLLSGSPKKVCRNLE